MKNQALIMLALLLFPASYAQEKAGDYPDPIYLEELHATTDRELYITGETVHMKIFSLNGRNHTPGSFSKVFYSDMTDRYGNPAVQVKSLFDGTSGNVSFRIPDTLATGVYYIRTFTTWMKNFPESMFSHKKIAVVNPYGSFSMPDRVKPGSSTDTAKGTGQGNYSAILTADPQNPARREKVKLELLVRNEEGEPLEGEFSLSITKRIRIPGTDHEEVISILEANETANFCQPETGGYIIRGTIRDRSTGRPLKNEPLSMGIAGKKARCRFTKSDEDGEFMFRTDIAGKHILVIQPLDPSRNDYIVELSDPFPPRSEMFVAGPLHIDSALSVKIDGAIVAAQVSGIYAEGITRAEKDGDKDFYGQPERTVLLSGYIELKSLREVIRELVPGVMVTRNDGKDAFRIINKYPTGQFTAAPLIIFDGIPVYDIDQLLAFNPAEIGKIDIVNIRYYFDDNMFEGIINVVSRKGDLKLYEFPEAVFRQEHEFLQEYLKPPTPDYSSEHLKESRIPDTRNTLCWEPEVRTGKDGRATLEFFTGDDPGEYEISLEGFSQDGVYVKSSAILVVGL